EFRRVLFRSRPHHPHRRQLWREHKTGDIHMTTTDMPSLPSSDEIDATIKHVTDNAQRVFLWNYDRSRDQLVTLYNKAMSSQWNSVTDLDWATEVDPEELVRTSRQGSMITGLARAAAEVDGSPFAKWGEKEFLQLGIESLKA